MNTRWEPTYVVTCIFNISAVVIIASESTWVSTALLLELSETTFQQLILIFIYRIKAVLIHHD